MRKLVTIVLTLVTVGIYALPVECVGTATQVVEGTDTLFVFTVLRAVVPRIG